MPPKLGKSFVYLGDEFYILAGMPLPEAEWYDGFPQLENGIGLSRNFWKNGRRQAKLPRLRQHKQRYTRWHKRL